MTDRRPRQSLDAPGKKKKREDVGFGSAFTPEKSAEIIERDAAENIRKLPEEIKGAQDKMKQAKEDFSANEEELQKKVMDAKNNIGVKMHARAGEMDDVLGQVGLTTNEVLPALQKYAVQQGGKTLSQLEGIQAQLKAATKGAVATAAGKVKDGGAMVMDASTVAAELSRERRDAATRQQDQMKATGTNQIKATGTKIEATGTKIEATGTNQIKATGTKIEATGTNQIKATGTNQIKATGTNQIKETGTKIEAQNAAALASARGTAGLAGDVKKAIEVDTVGLEQAAKELADTARATGANSAIAKASGEVGGALTSKSQQVEAEIKRQEEKAKAEVPTFPGNTITIADEESVAAKLREAMTSDGAKKGMEQLRGTWAWPAAAVEQAQALAVRDGSDLQFKSHAELVAMLMRLRTEHASLRTEHAMREKLLVTRTKARCGEPEVLCGRKHGQWCAVWLNRELKEVCLRANVADVDDGTWERVTTMEIKIGDGTWERVISTAKNKAVKNNRSVQKQIVAMPKEVQAGLAGLGAIVPSVVPRSSVAHIPA